MEDIESFGYLALGVPDLQRAITYLSDVCRLAVVDQNEGMAFLTGDERHHWFRLEVRDEPELIRLGFQAAGPDSVERLVARLEKAGTEVAEVPADEGINGAVRFLDPNGLTLEVYPEMSVAAVRPPSAYPGLNMLLHAVVQVPDPLASTRFYEEVLGFRRSDRIAELVVFLRAGNGYHHSIALARGGRTKLDHVAVHVHGLDDVMRVRSHGMATGTLSDDVVRHTASGSISVYLRDEVNDLGVEFCTQHAIIDDIDYRGRVLVPSPTTVNIWSDPFPAGEWVRDPTRVDGTRGATDAARTAIGPVPVNNS